MVDFYSRELTDYSSPGSSSLVCQGLEEEGGGRLPSPPATFGIKIVGSVEDLILLALGCQIYFLLVFLRCQPLD